MAMSVTVKHRFSEEEFLQGKLISEINHEFINSEVYALAGAIKNHERISVNLKRKFGNFLEISPYESFSTEINVKGGRNFFTQMSWWSAMIKPTIHIEASFQRF